MFVAITPTSIYSSWIYFESGYSYSKEVLVVPVGLFGIDLGNMNPPLSLLQGFNIDSHMGLNNIIAIINRKFNTSYKEAFTRDDFKYLLSEGSQKNNAGQLSKFINEIRFDVAGKLNYDRYVTYRYVTESEIDKITTHFQSQEKEYTIGYRSISAYGIRVEYDGHGEDCSLSIYLDPYNYRKNLRLVLGIYEIATEKGVETINFYIEFNSRIGAETSFYRVASRIEGTQTQIVENDEWLSYDKFMWKMEYNYHAGKAYARAIIKMKTENLEEFSLEDFFDLLLSNEVIWERN